MIPIGGLRRGVADLDRIGHAGRVGAWIASASADLTSIVTPLNHEPDVPPEDSVPSAVHRPVLLDEVIAGLDPKPGAVIVDGTVGAGGHARAIAERVGPSGRVIGLDRDPEMLALAEEATTGLPVTLVNSAYSDLDRVMNDLELDGVDGILLDLGLSSDQLAWSHRGFSFSQDGPLDMRFDPKTRESAADLINDLTAEELADIFFQFGEERHSRKIARRIVEARRVEPITTTARLADLVRKSIPGKWGPIDPATRVFQALRIAVNQELEHLDVTLANLADWLNPGGRAAIISFHSLEDRRVKHSFRNDPQLEVITRKPITATPEEIQINSRARSAKLRVAEKCTRPTDIPSPTQTRT
ncbi:MAG: S-adenosyl-methyltransferase MraW [Planctomycetota bacterium]|nr:S-adenosyl-methyltransferase MraW [Planctomycetota bacterium]